MESNLNMKPEDWTWFSQQLCGKIADTHMLTEKIRDLEAQNNLLQSKLDTFSLSFRDLNDLYVKAMRNASRLQDELTGCERKSILLAEANEKLIGENRFLRLQSEQLGAVDTTIANLEKEKAGLKRKINDMARKCSRNHVSRKEKDSGNVSEIRNFRTPENRSELTYVDYEVDVMGTCAGATIVDAVADSSTTDNENKQKEDIMLQKVSQSTMTENSEKPELITKSTMTEPVKIMLRSNSITSECNSVQSSATSSMEDEAQEMKNTTKVITPFTIDNILRKQNFSEVRNCEISEKNPRNFEKSESINVDYEGTSADVTTVDTHRKSMTTGKENKQNTILQCTQSTLTEISILVEEEDHKLEKHSVSQSTMTEDVESITKSTMTEPEKIVFSSNSNISEWGSAQTSVKSTMTEEVQERRNTKEVATQFTMDDIALKGNFPEVRDFEISDCAADLMGICADGTTTHKLGESTDKVEENNQNTILQCTPFILAGKEDNKLEKNLVSQSTMIENLEEAHIIAESTITEPAKTVLSSIPIVDECSSVQTSVKGKRAEEVQEKRITTKVDTASSMYDIAQKVLLSQLTVTEQSHRTDRDGMQKSLKKYVSVGTQHKYSTTTRATCTSAFIKKHNVGTNFPKDSTLSFFDTSSISIEQILKETVLDLPVAIEPIEELPTHLLSRSIGTETVINDIRKSVGIIEVDSVESNCENRTESIKIEEEMGHGLLLSGKKNQSDCLETSLKTMWSMFGNIIIAMICRNRDSDRNSEELLAREFGNMIENLKCHKAEGSCRKDVTPVHQNDIAGQVSNNEESEKSSVSRDKKPEQSSLRPDQEDCFKVEENSKDSSECLQNVGSLNVSNDPFVEESIQREIIHNSTKVHNNHEDIQMELDNKETTFHKKPTESNTLFAEKTRHEGANAFKTDQNNTTGKRKRKKVEDLSEQHTKNKIDKMGINSCSIAYKPPLFPTSSKFEGVKFVREENPNDHSELNNVAVEGQTLAEPFSKSPKYPPTKELKKTGTNLKKDTDIFIPPKNGSTLKVLDIAQVKNNLRNIELQSEDFVNAEVQSDVKFTQNISSCNSTQTIHNSRSASPTKEFLNAFSPIKLTGVMKSKVGLKPCTVENQNLLNIPQSDDKKNKEVRQRCSSGDSSKTCCIPTTENWLKNESNNINKAICRMEPELKQNGPILIKNGFNESTSSSRSTRLKYESKSESLLQRLSSGVITLSKYVLIPLLLPFFFEV